MGEGGIVLYGSVGGKEVAMGAQAEITIKITDKRPILLIFMPSMIKLTRNYQMDA